MKRTIVEIHMLETTSVANLNRDGANSPKTVVYGGVERARVSSQAWKRAARELFDGEYPTDRLAVRTRHAVRRLADSIIGLRPDMPWADAVGLADGTFNSMSMDTVDPRKSSASSTEGDEGETVAVEADGDIVVPVLKTALFLGNAQYDRLAEFVLDCHDRGVELQKSDKKLVKQLKALISADRALDVALFGRMIADDPTLTVEGAVSVAHAFSVNPSPTESDYFTTVDEYSPTHGAAMIDESEFNTATWYRYGFVDVDRLHDTLGDAPTVARVVGGFVDAFIRSIPSGKRHAYAQAPLPELVVVNVRDTQPVSMAAAYRMPVRGNTVREASQRMTDLSAEFDRNYGTTPVASYVIRVGDDTMPADAMGERVTLPELRDRLEALVSDRMGDVD